MNPRGRTRKIFKFKITVNNTERNATADLPTRTTIELTQATGHERAQNAMPNIRKAVTRSHMKENDIETATEGNWECKDS